MVSQVAFEPPSIRQDGFGTRLMESGPKERLVLSPVLSTPGAEQAIRARASHLTRIDPGPLARVLRVERTAASVAVLSERPDGATLSDILAALEFGTLTLSDDEALELSASVVRAAARLHEGLGTLSHGALAPAHVVLRRDGSTTFTSGVFGDAIQARKWNRERIWREFGLPLPPSAGAPRFDQRGDVMQLGALVLAIGQRRSLRRDEFPRGIAELAGGVSIAQSAQANSKLRAWLQDALQLHGRVVFDSAIDAARRFGRLLPRNDEARVLALQTAILQLCGEPIEPTSASSWGSSGWNESRLP
jgi:hypothetical protein